MTTSGNPRASQRIDPHAYEALKQAIAYTTYYKNAQRSLLLRHLGGEAFETAGLHLIDFSSGFKIQNADKVVEALQAKEDRLRDTIIDLFLSLSEMVEFPDIEGLEEPKRSENLRRAQLSVEGLTKFTQPFQQMMEKRARIEKERRQEESQRERKRLFMLRLEDMKQRLLDMHQTDNPQQRGRDFEDLIYDLFDLHDLNPERPYNLPGEQIDGFVQIDRFGFIVEVKWEQERSGRDIADIFRAKIERRSRVTQGLLITQAGIASTTLDTYSVQSPFMVVTGMEIYSVLDGRTDLRRMLETKKDHLSQTGSCFYDYLKQH